MFYKVRSNPFTNIYFNQNNDNSKGKVQKNNKENITIKLQERVQNNPFNLGLYTDFSKITKNQFKRFLELKEKEKENQEKFKEFQEQLKAVNETMEMERKNRKAEKIAEKVAKGESITEEERRFLEDHDKELYDKAMRAKKEKEMYENMIKNAKTKQQAQEVISMARISALNALKSDSQYGILLSKSVDKLEKDLNNLDFDDDNKKNNFKNKKFNEINILI